MVVLQSTQCVGSVEGRRKRRRRMVVSQTDSHHTAEILVAVYRIIRADTIHLLASA